MIENDESPLRATKQRRVDYPSSASGGTLTVAELSTRNPQGTIDKLLIKVDRVTTIGRKPTCDYILNEPTVSSTHCIIHT
ncbi:hypothetical protein FRC15_011043 [Serendipita sp. 397]|nr:hypothetical protein FRC15_011043 [Serendipita sp. 397]